MGVSYRFSDLESVKRSIKLQNSMSVSLKIFKKAEDESSQIKLIYKWVNFLATHQSLGCLSQVARNKITELEGH